MNQYVVATVKPWNIEAFERRRMALPGHWHLIESRADLTTEALERISPRVTYFDRRRSEQSVVSRAFYDHIRMLDAETYPLAFVDYGAYRLEFSSAELRGSTLRAQVEIRTKDEGRKP